LFLADRTRTAASDCLSDSDYVLWLNGAS